MIFTSPFLKDCLVISVGDVKMFLVVDKSLRLLLRIFLTISKPFSFTEKNLKREIFRRDSTIVISFTSMLLREIIKMSFNPYAAGELKKNLYLKHQDLMDLR